MAYSLSIVIPHYNSPKKLRRMLESIPLSESIQVIVVDDLSTSEIEEYNTIKDYFSQKGGGGILRQYTY